MALKITVRSRLFAALALAGAMGVLGAAPAGAEPPAPPVLPGMDVVVDDVLGPQDTGFWDPAVPGTRIWTPVESGVMVTCASGFEPVISCSTIDMRVLTPQRSLAFVDVPVVGGPLRVWFDVPQLTDVFRWKGLLRV